VYIVFESLLDITDHLFLKVYMRKA